MVIKAWAKPAPPKPPIACQLIISMKPDAGLGPRILCFLPNILTFLPQNHPNPLQKQFSLLHTGRIGSNRPTSGVQAAYPPACRSAWA